MRKIGVIFFVFVLCSMTFGVSATNSHQFLLNTTKDVSGSFSETYTDAPPDWATGNFSGVWGINAFGVPLPAAGWVKGYYADRFFARIEGEYGVFTNMTNGTGSFFAIGIGPFLLGGINSYATENGTYLTGLGGVNETTFYWRINLIIGPTFYMHGNYSKFE